MARRYLLAAAVAMAACVTGAHAFFKLNTEAWANIKNSAMYKHHDPEDLRFQVEPLSKDCLEKEVTAGVRVTAELLVIRGGLLDINFQVVSPSGATLFERLIFSNKDESGNELAKVEAQGHTFTTTETGAYQFCFDNTMSRYTAKVVEFEYQAYAVAGLNNKIGEVLQTDTLTDRMKARVERVHAIVDEVVEEAKYHNIRITASRATGRSTHSRAVWWTVAEMMAVIAASVGQVLYFKLVLFKNKRRDYAGV